MAGLASARKTRAIVRPQPSAAGLSVIEQIESHPGSTMSVAQLAEIFAVTPKAIYAAVNRGEIPLLNVPGINVKRFDPRTLSMWLRSHNPLLNMSLSNPEETPSAPLGHHRSQRLKR